MSSIDERVVQMKFNNVEFQRGIQQTISSLERLNKTLQLQGAATGLKGVTTAAQQFDQRMAQGRDNLGRFTTSMQQTSTSTGNLAQKLDAGKEAVGRVGQAFSSAGQVAQSFGQKVEQGRNALGQFASKMGETSNEANKQSGSLKNLEGSVNSLANRFSTLGSIATGALMNIGARVQEAGMRFANSFSFGPIMDGFREYELNMNSIQTILANTQAAGTNLKDVTGALDELNHYSDQTIYNFSEMAKNIGTFTAAGVGLKESTAAIKGIANLAAISGSNSQQASGAMYQLSQAISAGRVSLEDWNSVVNAGMGGTVFQRALAQTAVAMGKLDSGAVKLTGDMKNVTIEGESFRNSISAENGESWLTSEVLTNTLAQFTGDLTDAELAAQGFTKAQIKSIQAQAKMAQDAATQVKTLSQLFGTFKEQLGSGWAQTWQIIFGDFAEAKGLFTGISESVGDMLQKSSDARNKMLQDWKALGGRGNLIAGINNSVKALGAVLAPIKDAFRQIFPATTGKQLADLSRRFKEFTANLTIGSDTANKLKRTFAGVFAVFGIAVDVIKGIVGVIGDLARQLFKGSGGFLDFTAKVGDFLVALRKGIREGEGLTNFFAGLSTVLRTPIQLVQKFIGLLGSMFKGDVDSKRVEKSVENVSRKLEPLGHLGEVVSKAWSKTLTVMENVGDFFQDLGKRISEVMKNFGIDASTMFDGLDFEKLLAGLNTGLLAGLFLIIKNFLSEGPAGLFEGISDAIEGFTGTLKGMQNALNAATLLQIAIAVGILAVSMNILSKIDSEGLTRASAAISVMFGQLLGSLALFNKFIGTAGFAKLPFVMGSLILLAAAVLILSQAVQELAELDWNELAKGLTGLAVTLGLVVGSLKLMPNPKGMISTGLGMIALAAAIKILASAVEDMSQLGWNELAKGLVGVGTTLGALALFTKFAKVQKGAVAQGAGIILLAAGIKILASAMKDFSQLNWEEIAKGIVSMSFSMNVMVGALNRIPPGSVGSAFAVAGVAASLLIVAEAMDRFTKFNWKEIGKSAVVMGGALSMIAAALKFIPPTAVSSAASVLIVSGAMVLIGEALSTFAEFSWGEIGKAMAVLAGSLGIIAGAMMLMTTALPGAAATLIVAGALNILAPVLQKFGEMSLSEVGTALLMLAGVFVIFAASAILLAPAIPLMFAMGAAIALLGVGMLAAGAGMFLFATGLTALAAAGSAASAMIIGIVAGLIGLIPEVMKQIGLGLIAFAEVISTAGPSITKALVTVLEALIAAIVRVTPKIVDALLRLLTMLLQKLSQYVPLMVDAGLKLLTGLLRGIANNIGRVLTEATRVVTEFLKGIGKNLPKIIQSGFDLIIKFLQGVRKAIDSNSETLGSEGGKLAVAIIKGMVKGLSSGLQEVQDAAWRVAKSALDSAKNALGIHSPSKEFEKIGNFVNDGFRKGLDGNKQQVYDAFNKLKTMLKDLSKSSKATASERARAAKAYTTLTKSLNDEKTKIGKLADQYDKLTEKIKAANDEYKAAIKTRDDYRQSITDQYGDVASPTGETTVADFKENLRKQIEDTKVYANTLQRLRALGLNDEMYKDLLSAGTSALPFAEELLAGGKAGVDELNKLGKDLDTVAGKLGKDASTALYQAGVDAARGLVVGLQKEQANLEKIMDKLANKMVSTIKAKLKIKSPSRVFQELGEFSAKGLVKGLDGMSGSVGDAAERTGEVAIAKLGKTLGGFSDLITSDVDFRPVITPVLDLSEVQRDAGYLGSLLNARPIQVDSAYSKAISIATGVSRNRSLEQALAERQAAAPVSFTQINNSPKALSSADIYRQTNNQLSRAKGALSQR